MKQINKIKNLLQYLPQKDIPIGTKLLDNRDLDSLQSLVKSAIVRTIRGRQKDPPDERYVNIDINYLQELRAELDQYIFTIYPPDESYTIYDDLELY